MNRLLARFHGSGPGRSRLLAAGLVAMVAALACGIPAPVSQPSADDVPTRERTPIPVVIVEAEPSTVAATATLPPPEPTIEATTASPTTSPTPLPPATPAPRPPRPTAAPLPTSTPDSYPPLQASWQMLDKATPEDNNIVAMTIRMGAQGGDGNYTYLWDGQVMPGPEFQIRYPAASIFTTRLAVRSGDGQIVEWLLYEWIAWYATPMGGEQKGCQEWYPGMRPEEKNC